MHFLVASGISTDQVRNVTVMNAGTFIGAIAFLVGAVLLLPTRTVMTADP
jgi:hypothetical protein